MRIIHLGGNRLGERVLDALSRFAGDDIVSVIDLQSLTVACEAESPDWLVSAGCRFIIPPEILRQAGDTVNVHTSLLPWGKGANPNVWAILDGEPAGVSLHRMVADVDAGPVFAQRAVATTLGDTARDLYLRLQAEAITLFENTWPHIRAGTVKAAPSNSGGSRHRKADMQAPARIDLDKTVTWRHALNVLRALTFPPHRNIVVESDGRRYHVEIVLNDVTDEVVQGSGYIARQPTL